ncbi:MAG: EAL domain-containing protein [Olsenella sp.]|nr:EAL domain-containing protein [Olsenella sp.]
MASDEATNETDGGTGVRSGLARGEAGGGRSDLLEYNDLRAVVNRVLAGGGPAWSHEAPNSIVFFNIENFKHYNQRYGFAAGDVLLEHLAASVIRAFPCGFVARFTADQYLVFTHTANVVEGVRQVRHDFRAKHKDSSIWLRAGYYELTEEDKVAGLACDRAKIACDELRGRRDSFVRRYDDELRHKIMLRRYVLGHIDEALEEGWLHAWCQPIVRVATGEICDLEVLTRWVDPTKGVIAPADFIPVLEDARIIHLLDLSILRSACEVCKGMADAESSYIPFSVNLSRLDFELCDIVSEVEAVLAEYGIPHDKVAIELTESALAGNREFLKGEVDRFREDGLEVWMDDFGSGYSSLNILKDYTFDLVKFDMAFLRGFESSGKGRVMLAKVVDMVKELGMKTLAEGVETQEQYDFLRSLGCGRAQGFFFGRPQLMPPSVEEIREQTGLPVEILAKREFYEDIGRVNLMRPDPQPWVGGKYLPSDVACSIICRRNGRYEHLNTNDLFVQFLREAGIGTVEDNERMLNDPDDPRREGFVDALNRCIQSNGWERYSESVGSRLHAVRIRLVSQLPDYDAVAVLSIVDEYYRAGGEDGAREADNACGADNGVPDGEVPGVGAPNDRVLYGQLS